MTCRHCGKEIADASRFCKYCGGRQEAASVERNESAVLAEAVSTGEEKTDQNAEPAAQELVTQEPSVQEPVKSPGLQTQEPEKPDERLTKEEIILLVVALGVVLLMLYLAIRFVGLGVTLVIAIVAVWLFRLSPEKRKEKLAAFRKSVLKELIAVIVVVGLLMAFIPELRYWAGALFYGKGVPTSTFEDYPGDNIGTAFYEYFDGGKWENYKLGGEQFVTFSGDYMSEGLGEVDVVFTFKLNGDDTFTVYETQMNGRPVGLLLEHMMLSDIFEESTSV